MVDLYPHSAPYLNATSAPSADSYQESNVNEREAAATSRNVRRVSSFSLLPSRIPPPGEPERPPEPKDPHARMPPSTQRNNEYKMDRNILEPDWRLKDRMKTVGVGLILCLNIGTDPPDVTKPQPCAKLQCWIDPLSLSRSKAKELIADRLESQYAKWQLAKITNKANSKYRKISDGTVDDVRSMCLALRRQARNERILIHYNGHGVPRPTRNGEIWVFDRQHSEYIPLSVIDLRQWMGKPSLVVLDCSSAGVLLPFLTTHLHQGNQSNTSLDEMHANTTPDNHAAWTTWSTNLVKDTLVLAACSEGEWLPMQPDYPADIFTCCLTTPIQIALRWFVRRNPWSMGGIDPESVDNIPGQANDRKTPLGELNWIFTAVTDSIAWNVLPRALFQRLFRQDLMVASMFRNFLLAQRILQSLGCTPVSHPPLPSSIAEHPLWEAWDLACENLLCALAKQGILRQLVPSSTIANDDEPKVHEAPVPLPTTPLVALPNISSPFFSEQLTAFEVWLKFASIHKQRLGAGELESPEQLPVVLQVLLSQIHRVRALQLLHQFLDLGTWAVNLSLSLGIFPYVMKLLQSPEYKSLLVSIWATILSFDPSCRMDLLKDNAFHYFVQHLTWGLENTTVRVDEAAHERTLAAYVLSVLCHKYPAGQSECVRLGLHNHCCALLSSYEQGEKSGDSAVEQHLPPEFRLWVCLVLGNMVQGNTPVQSEAYHAGVHARLSLRLLDKSPDVRTAVCYAFGCLIGSAPKIIPGGNQSSEDLFSMQQQGQRQGGHFTQGTSFAGQRLPATAATIVLPGSQSNPTILQPHFGGGGPSVPNLNWRPQIEPVRSATELAPSQPQNLVATGPSNGQTSASVGGPSGFLVGTNPVVAHGQASLLNPMQGTRPTAERRMINASIFEDHTRLDNDLYSMECLRKACNDGSVSVRYEASIALSNGVVKYLDGFAVAAEDVAGEETQSSLSRASFPVPQGLDRRFVKRLAAIYKSLRFLQRHDTFPAVAKVANDAISLVHQRLLMYRMEQERVGDLLDVKNITLPSEGNRAGLLADISEDSEGRSQDLASSMHASKASTPKAMPISIPPPSDIRRVSSEMLGGTAGTLKKDGVRRSRLSDGGEDTKYDSPESEFYAWKSSSYVVNTNAYSNNSRDLLSPNEAVRSQTNERNDKKHHEGMELASRYTSLAPKPPKPRQQSIEMILEEEDHEGNEALDVEAAKKKDELTMVETELIKNHGVKMTSMLMFHSYEDILVACGATDSVSIFDTRNGKCLNSFMNMNPRKTSMTSCVWINEESNSLLLVGSDDGSVRIWGNILDELNGDSPKPPRLVTSFFAATMGAEARRNGLVCEWQPWNGNLLAGGGSKIVEGWDLYAEKKAFQLESTSSGTVTTLTTAWDGDQLGMGPPPYNGIGRDVVVAGHSDGSIKIFDLRVHLEVINLQNAGSPARARRKRVTEYHEHKSWVVSTSFRGYDNRYELISGTLGGQIKAWDLRMSSSTRTVEAQRSPMTTCAVHSRVPIVATGSHAQFIKLLTLDGETMQVIRYHEKMQNNRIGPVSCVAFHRHKPLMAAGATDTYIGLFGSRRYLK